MPAPATFEPRAVVACDFGKVVVPHRRDDGENCETGSDSWSATAWARLRCKLRTVGAALDVGGNTRDGVLHFVDGAAVVLAELRH